MGSGGAGGAGGGAATNGGPGGGIIYIEAINGNVLFGCSRMTLSCIAGTTPANVWSIWRRRRQQQAGIRKLDR